MPLDVLTPPRDRPTDDVATPMTRRERIAAERAAAGLPVRSTVAVIAAPVRETAPVQAPATVAVVHAAPIAEDHPARTIRPARAARPLRRPSRPTVRRSVAAVTTARPTARPAVRTGAGFRRTASRITAVAALLFAAGLVVSTSVPAQALFTPAQARTVAVQAAGAGAAQSMTVGDTTDGVTTRDGYTVSDTAQYAHTSNTFTNDPNGTIQWPFLTGVPISSGFGGRNVEGCSFCSTFHEGADFAPGAGTPIRVVAAGTVIKVQADDGGYGNDVWVQHDVDGKQFVSVYGHMLDNSFKVVEGQQVNVGDELGQVGSTGNSTGPHLHLEIHVDGVPVDPVAWLQANAN